jgi:hypothetical protein
LTNQQEDALHPIRGVQHILRHGRQEKLGAVIIYHNWWWLISSGRFPALVARIFVAGTPWKDHGNFSQLWLLYGAKVEITGGATWCERLSRISQAL